MLTTTTDLASDPFATELATLILKHSKVPPELPPAMMDRLAFLYLAACVQSVNDKAFPEIAALFERARGFRPWKAKDRASDKRDELRTFIVEDLRLGQRHSGADLYTHAGVMNIISNSITELEDQDADRGAAERAAAAELPVVSPEVKDERRGVLAKRARARKVKPETAPPADIEPTLVLPDLTPPDGPWNCNCGGPRGNAPHHMAGDWRCKTFPGYGASEPAAAPVVELEVEGKVETFANDNQWIDRLAPDDTIEIAWQPEQSGTRTTLGGPRSKTARFVRWAKPRPGEVIRSKAVVNIQRVDSKGRGIEGAYGSDRTFPREDILSLYRKADGSSIVVPAAIVDRALREELADANVDPAAVRALIVDVHEELGKLEPGQLAVSIDMEDAGAPVAIKRTAAARAGSTQAAVADAVLERPFSQVIDGKVVTVHDADPDETFVDGVCGCDVCVHVDPKRRRSVDVHGDATRLLERDEDQDAAELARAETKPEAAKRGRRGDQAIYDLMKTHNVAALQKLYAELYGRPTNAKHHRVLAWRVVKAQRALEAGKNPREGMPTPRGAKKLTLTVEAVRALLEVTPLAIRRKPQFLALVDFAGELA